MADYIQWLRGQVGSVPLQLNFAAACICQDGQVLLQHRGDHHAWGFPGGAIELGESAQEAVTREALEETGLQIEVQDLLGVYTKYLHTYPNGDAAQPIAVFFRCAPIGGQLRVDGVESLALRYFPIDDVPSLFSHQHQDALDDLKAGRAGMFR